MYIGTSGFTLQNFYPADIAVEKLKYYQNTFNTVEINSTFYHLPRQATIAKWSQQVSSTFVFSIKAWQKITHQTDGLFDQEALLVFIENLAPLQNKKPQHIILFQFPSSKNKDDLQLQLLIKRLLATFLYAFEFRHPSWFDKQVYTSLVDKRATVVISDGPIKKDGNAMFPKYVGNDFNFNYLRFHGSQQLYASSYSGTELEKYSQLIEQSLVPTYAYFNNDMHGYAAQNARSLQAMLES